MRTEDAERLHGPMTFARQENTSWRPQSGTQEWVGLADKPEVDTLDDPSLSFKAEIESSRTITVGQVYN